MTDFKIDARDVFFILKEQLDYGRLCALDSYRDLNENALDLLVNEAIRFARGVLDPLNAMAEENPIRFESGNIYCPDGFKDAFQQYAGNGWIALALVVFASWKPWRVLLGACLFGGVRVLQLNLQAAGVAIPVEYLAMSPYLITIIVLVIMSADRSRAPASLGKGFHAGS